MNVTKFRTWCLLSLQSRLSPHQEAVFNNWLEGHPKRLKQFQGLKTMWDQTVPEPLNNVDVEAQWKLLEARLNREAVVNRKSNRRIEAVRFSRARKKWLPALGFAFAVILAFILFRNPGSVRSGLLSVASSDTTRELVLSDGSRIYLNHASEFEAEQPFPDTLRTVKMRGEVFFEVEENQAPFEVVTDQARVRVMGTRFNVWARESRTRVVVTSGCIHFTDSNRSGSVLMKPGELSEVISMSPPTPVRHIPIESADNRPGWLNGLLEFYRMPLTDIAAELSRTFGTPIHVDNPALGARSVTATYSNESLETILESLALTLHMKIIRDETGIVLKGVEEE
jgi:transmembrane sensor